MRKITFFLVLLCGIFIGYSQDCSIQRMLSNDVLICLGQGTTITLFGSESGVSYQLRDASNNPIGFPVIGMGGNINFVASPSTTTTYNVIAGTCLSAYLDTVTITVFQPSVGGNVTVSAVGITPVVTVNTICHLGSGWLYLSGHTGNVIRWESSINGGNTWTPIAHGAIDSELETPIFNSFGLATCSIQFNHALLLTTGATAKVWLSLDGGNTYNILLSSYTGAITRTPYNNFPQENINLNNYIGQPNL